MKLHTTDLLIICAYLIAMIVIGLILKKRAAQNMDSYFLGGKSLPFYMLGLSNASGMFDITGTMLMVYWAFAYGFKSLWIPWLWPVFNQIFTYPCGCAVRTFSPVPNGLKPVSEKGKVLLFHIRLLSYSHYLAYSVF